MDLDSLIKTREKTHGSWVDQAGVAQKVKAAFKTSGNWDSLLAHEREAIEMIAVKLSRILTGDAHYAEHWDDIAGYAKLAADNNRPSLPVAAPVPPWPSQVSPPATATSSVEKPPELFDNLYSDAKNAGAAVATSTMAVVAKYKSGGELTDAEKALYTLWAETNEPATVE